jgi:hypothetical protein
MAGNANSGRKAEKPFADALRVELAALGDDKKGLRNIAKQLIAKATAGEMQAIQELANRTDGKVAQQLIHTGDEDGGPLVHRIERVVVDPKA